jgi:hypothetical protein
MGIHQLADAAIRELQSITQKPGESVTQYYHRLLPLWSRAGTTERERVKKFKTTLRPSLANYMWWKEHVTMREALDDARRIEEARAEINFQHPQTPRGRGTGNQTQLPTNQNEGFKPQRTSLKPAAANSPRAPSNTPRSRKDFPPVSQKPNGWPGEWFDPVEYPNKLTENEKVLLQRQGRCWACRGSGHRASDPCCPKFASRGKALNEVTAESIAEELSDSENA